MLIRLYQIGIEPFLVWESVSFPERKIGMRVLLSNDDGIRAEGIRALAKVFCRKHDVVLCAPMHEQSGMAHALNVHRRLEVARCGDIEALYPVEAWTIDGTPTDCVKIYLDFMAEDVRPDLVISGINHGANLATDVLYSGTVGAAMEGYLHDVPSVAISLDRHSEIPFEQVAEIAAEYLERTMAEREAPFFLNLNFPKVFAPEGPRFVFSQLGKRDYLNAFQKVTDEDGRTYFTVAGDIVDLDKGEATDIYAVESGFISVTPLHADLTDYVMLDAQLRK